MNQRLHSSSWRGGRDQRLWLSALVDAMEQVARQQARRADVEELKAFRTQLALPGQPRFSSPFSLRN
ncbi:MAG: hypothetical protein ACRC1G_09090 [Bradyrhizobium sp.]